MILSAAVQCPAKVNLFLEVTGRRRDGYHTLATIFAKISLFDTLEIESAPPGPVEFSVEQNDAFMPIPEGEDNLVLRAARAYREAFGVRCGARLRLKKGIPAAAGLGGGSSDAAWTLLGMHRVFGPGGGKPPGARAAAVLRRLAVGLGADVPFFLRREPLCVARGIGDRLRPLDIPKALPWMLLVYPDCSVSTRQAYRGLPRSPRRDVLTRLAQLGRLEKKLGGGRPVSEWAGLLFNRLEDAVLPGHPGIVQAKRVLGRLGVRGALMSGSGSCVFGFVASHQEGERVRRILRAYPWKVFLASCLG